MVTMMIERIDLNQLDRVRGRCDPLVREHAAVDLDTVNVFERGRIGNWWNHTREVPGDHRRKRF